MIRLYAVVLLSIFTLACAQFGQAASAIPPGSFIRSEANSVDQLIKQVQQDPVVRKRYASHFGVSPEYLVDYLKNEVELVTLREPLKTRVWYIGKNGRIISKTKLLPRGSQVFANKQGTPLILWRCGNPLISVLPEMKPAPAPPVVEVKPIGPEIISIPPVLAPPVATLSPVTGAVESASAGAAAGPIAAIPSVVTAGGGGGGLGFLPVLAGGGGLLLFTGGGGGSDDTRVPPPPVIPEFPTAALALVGLLPAGLMAARRRRQV